MKKMILPIMILPMLFLSGFAADQTIAPLPKMTAAEASETVLPDGVIVRITDTSPADVRVGDGETAGGIQIGDGEGWQEGDTLTQDLYTGGHTIHLGDWSILTLGGWGAIAGGSESVSNDGTMQFSVLGSILFELSSESSLVNISSFVWVSPYFEITTLRGEVQPTIMFSSNLVSGAWAEATVAEVVTNETTFVFKVEAPTSYGYFRATIPSGSGSMANFTATIRQNGEPVVTTGTVNLSGRLFDDGTNLFVVVGSVTNQLTSN
jgi:hypothetical protein